jgi:hypothetical protein
MDVWATNGNVDEDGDLIPIQDTISNPFGIVSDQYDTEADKLRVDFSNDIRTTLGITHRPLRILARLLHHSLRHCLLEKRDWASKLTCLVTLMPKQRRKANESFRISTNASTCEPARVRPPSLEANSRAEIQGKTQS